MNEHMFISAKMREIIKDPDEIHAIEHRAQRTNDIEYPHDLKKIVASVEGKSRDEILNSLPESILSTHMFPHIHGFYHTTTLTPHPPLTFARSTPFWHARAMIHDSSVLYSVEGISIILNITTKHAGALLNKMTSVSRILPDNKQFPDIKGGNDEPTDIKIRHRQPSLLINIIAMLAVLMLVVIICFIKIVKTTAGDRIRSFINHISAKNDI
jgi:hypothetical protein